MAGGRGRSDHGSWHRASVPGLAGVEPGAAERLRVERWADVMGFCGQPRRKSRPDNDEVAGYLVAEELVQDDLNAKALSKELFRLLEVETNKKKRKELLSVKNKLGHGGASIRAAKAILKEIATES